MAPSRPRWPSCAGRRSAVSPGTTSRRASHSRMASARASTVGCGMNVLTKRYSPPCAMHGWCSAPGGSTTIRSGPIPNSAAKHPPNSPASKAWGMPQTMLPSLQPSSVKGQDSTADRIQVREHVTSGSYPMNLSANAGPPSQSDSK